MQVDKSGHRIQRMFAAISPRYDFLNHFLSAGCDVYWRHATVRTVAPQGDAPILDVCTGTGDLAFAYWKAGGYRHRVVGADFTAEMLTLADRKLKKRLARLPKRYASDKNLRIPEFIEADTQKLPFPDDMFQIVSVAFGLRNVADTRLGLSEMVRVCQPGGRVAILEFTMPRHPLFRRIYTSYFRFVLPRIGQMLARNRDSAYSYLPASVAEFPQGEKLTDLMQDCGLEQTTWRSLTCGIAALYHGVKTP